MLRRVNLLTELHISPNPVSELPYFRMQVLRRRPELQILDGTTASATEKVKANVIYGDDVGGWIWGLFGLGFNSFSEIAKSHCSPYPPPQLAKQEEIFNRILPREQFVDRRLITVEAIERRELEMFGFIGRTAPEDEDLDNQGEE